MSKPQPGAGKAPAPRRKGDKSGHHAEPRRKLSAPQETWLLWDLAVAHAQSENWSEWARRTLTIAAATELGMDPSATNELIE